MKRSSTVSSHSSENSAHVIMKNISWSEELNRSSSPLVLASPLWQCKPEWSSGLRSGWKVPDCRPPPLRWTLVALRRKTENVRKDKMKMSGCIVSISNQAGGAIAGRRRHRVKRSVGSTVQMPSSLVEFFTKCFQNITFVPATLTKSSI